MRKALLFILFVCQFLVAPAQTYNTKPGFLVTLAGDTLHGLVRDRADLSEKVAFRKAADADFTTYTPEEISAFYLENGQLYETKIAEDKKRFLLTLVKGQLSLYQHATIFYLQKEGDVLRKLEKKDSIVNNIYYEDRRYIGILNYMLQDCKKIKPSQIAKTGFLPISLLKLVEAYNDCIHADQEKQVFRTPTKITFRPGLKVGSITTAMRYVSGSPAFNNPNFEPTQGFSGGASLRVTRNDKFAAQVEALLTQKGGHSVYDPGFGDFAIEKAKFSMTYLQFPLSVSYTLPTAKLRPFISAGGVYGYALSAEAYRTRFGEKFDLIATRHETGYRVGGGLEWKTSGRWRWYAEYSFERTVMNRNFVYQRIILSSHRIMMGMSF